MKLNGIHFLLSYRCTDECDHCFVWGSPAARGTFTLAQIHQLLRGIGLVFTTLPEGIQICIF